MAMGVGFALIWASAFTATRVIVVAIPPLTALVIRFAISGAIGIALARAAGQRIAFTRAEWRAIILFGISQNVLYLGLNWIGMQWVEASAAAIIASMMPLLVALAGRLFLGERLRPMAVVGLFAGFLGVALIMGARLGHGQVMDSMFLDGLEDAYDKGRLMGTFAEDCASEFQFTRAAQDDYALRSLTRAKSAITEGRFADEVVAVKVPGRGGETLVETDEQPGNARPDKIPSLKPAFRKDGTVTAANSSSISDGAAALVLSDDAQGAIARIVGYAGHAQAPSDFPTAPVPATEKLLTKLGWSKDDVDLWEVNEAFAVVPMAFMQKMGLSPEVVNVNGGACALGHPIGASGARIVVTLINALRQRGKRRGVAAICIGGGEGTALAVELI